MGAEGRYQYFLVFQASLMSMVMSMILYSTSFILADPDFYCGGRNGATCSEDQFCAKFPNPTSWTENNVDWKYGSWVQEYGVICGDGSHRG